MVTWLMQNVSGDPKSSAEFDKRMRTFHTGAVPRDWDPL